jgi:conjugative relaxase-like TrwC/TraI family protein
MVSLSDGAMTVEDAGTYYHQHYSTVGEYYAPDQNPTIGQALGKGAAALGLQGDITAEQFEALLHGCDPTTGAVLRAKVTHGNIERAGWDMTLSPPKSVSIRALVAGDTRLIEADRQAARRALQEAEASALGRRRGGKEWVQTANVVAVMFEHYDARESINGHHGPMPQLHHHVFITNLTQMPNGQWRGLDPDQIYKARRFIDGVYLSELSKRVQEIGYSIERRPDGAFELAGFTRKQIEAFSERTLDIKRAEAEQGLTNPVAARVVRLETRKPKRQHDPDALKAEREALAAEHGIRLDNHPNRPLRTFSASSETQAAQSLDFAIRHSTNRQAVVDHRDLLTAALKHGMGATDVDHIRARMAAPQHGLIAAGKSYLHPLDSYTTRGMVALERENLTLVRNGMGQGRPIAGIAIRSAIDGQLSSTGTKEVRDWTAARQLLPDQADAALLTLTTVKWASAIEGLAGTTKTTLVGAVREFAQDHGWTVRGFGTTSGSVQALNDAGIDSRTIAKLLATPLPPKAGRELWIIDESSLLATRPVNQLLKLARDRGVERIVFVGDQKQHLAIEAGSPVRQFLTDNMVIAQLTTIRRQQDPELRRAVELAANQQTAEAIDLLAQQKRIIEVPHATARYERIAADYLSGHEAGQRCLVVSPANDERNALNQAIRSTLIAHQYVASLGQKHRILIPLDMTPAQLQHARSYADGDVIQFTRGSKRQGIPKGYLTVAAVNDDRLTLQAENGRQFEFDPSRWKGMRVYSAETRTIAVGDRLQWREPDNHRRIANGQYATVTKLDAANIEVRLDKSRILSMPLANARKVDLGYASTSHAAQGSTVDRVLVNIDSHRSPDLVNERQLYVSLSRARIDARIYTNDAHAMRRAVSREHRKELALDVVQQQQPRQSTGMRI